jgi:hypothetical protein
VSGANPVEAGGDPGPSQSIPRCRPMKLGELIAICAVPAVLVLGGAVPARAASSLPRSPSTAAVSARHDHHRHRSTSSHRRVPPVRRAIASRGVPVPARPLPPSPGRGGTRHHPALPKLVRSSRHQGGSRHGAQGALAASGIHVPGPGAGRAGAPRAVTISGDRRREIGAGRSPPSGGPDASACPPLAPPSPLTSRPPRRSVPEPASRIFPDTERPHRRSRAAALEGAASRSLSPSFGVPS